MELLYVWIEDYKNIKKQGFNFSPKHWFDYEEKTNTLKHEERNPNYPKDFFGENISNVTAIVGKNGSGKSSVISRILNSLPRNTSSGDYFLIFKQKSKNPNEFILLTSKNKPQHTIASLEIVKIGESEDGYTNHEYNQFGTNLIYYSNDILYGEPVINYDPSNIAYNIKDVLGINSYDISSNGKMVNTPTIHQYKNETLFDLFTLFEKYSLISDKIPFPDYYAMKLMPYADKIEIVKRKITEVAQKDSTYSDNDFIINWEEYCDSCLSKTEERKDQSTILTHICYSIFFRFLEKHWERMDDRLNEIENLIEFDKWEFNSISSFFGCIANGSNKELFTKRTHEIVKLFIFLKDNYPNKIRPLRAYSDDHTFLFKLKEDLDLLKELYRLLTNIRYPDKNTMDVVPDFILFDSFFANGFKGYDLERYNYSTGEMSLLILLARLDRLKRTKPGENIFKDTILLIDEGELGFHPDWQREFLQLVISEVSNIFKQHKVQIILTTHSPFLASDLPKENIIFLKNGKCEVKPLEGITHTFGANIHSLYRNSFFLENGLMGEFAKGKIDQVIKDLNQPEEDIPEERRSEIKFIIEQIGEPLIKDKLLQKYKARFEPIEDQINELRLKIEKLEASRKN